MKNIKSIIFILLLVSGSAIVQAQETGDSDLDIIEMELDKPANQPTPVAKPAETENAANARAEEKPAATEELKDFSGLGRLAPFAEVSVIQKKFQPKTGRFQFFIGPTFITNDPFFNTFGGVAKAGYFLTESWGVEASYFGLSTSQRDATKKLHDNHNVNTANLAYPKSYTGLDLVFMPIYGKMTWFNSHIVPFDLYFSGGYGTTTTSTNENAGTIHVAAGQIFAITKGMSFRWDFSWNFYNATGITGEKSNFNNLFLTLGMSFFFPEANYR